MSGGNAAAGAAGAGRTMRIALPPSAASQAEDGAPLRGGGETDRPWRARRFSRDTPFYQLLESVYDAVLITTPDGMVLEANARAAVFFRRPLPDLVGIDVTTLISGAGRSLVDSIQANLRLRKFTLVDARAKRSDGTTFPAEIAVNSVQLDGEGELSFFFRDVTVRTQAQDKLRQAVERLETQDRARLEFVSNCSHELRTPLTSMIYAIENLLRGVAGPLPEKALDYLERLKSDSKRLLGTVNDILDLRQIETHTLAVIKAVAPLSAVLRDGAGPAAVQAGVKKIDFSVHVPPAELFSNCDARKISRVVLNIAGNAVKFTPAAGRISVTLAQDGADAVVTVDDTGAGVPPEDLPKLSQRYFHTGDQAGGSGLGLAISREIVELHNGSISFDSPVPGTDRGLRATVRLPLCSPPAVLVRAIGAEQDGQSEAIAGAMAKAGWAARIASASSPEALAAECKQARAAALALVPAQGEDAATRRAVIAVRSDPGTKFLPIVVFVRERLPKADVELARAFNLLVVRLPWDGSDAATLLAQAVLCTIR